MKRLRGKLRDPRGASDAVQRRVRRRLDLPPARPHGWVVGPPDFVGVGAQRSGTSWWYQLVCDHPAVAKGPGKEKHFFDRFHARQLDDDDVRAYHRLFPRPPGSITGEWTPRYMHDFWTPAQLRQAAPRAKILVLLRDPWSRFHSGVGHESSRALGRQLRRDRSGYLRATVITDALDRSMYLQQLLRVFEHFDRSQVLVLQYERCCADPEGELRRTYGFLGLDPGHRPAAIDETYGPSFRRADADPHLWLAARATLARDAVQLQELVPEIDLELWPSLWGSRGTGRAGRRSGSGARPGRAGLSRARR